MKYHLTDKPINGAIYGVVGELSPAICHSNRPEELRAYHFRSVSKETYENTVIDLRFEDGKWQQ